MSQIIQTIEVPALMKWLTQKATSERLAGETHLSGHTISTLITSLHTVTGYAAEKVKQSARGQGAA